MNKSIEIIKPGGFKTLRWKNGRGSTRELALEQKPHSEYFDWRLSMAPVLEDAVFSNFTGYNRSLVLVQGEGLELNHDSGQQDLLSKRFDTARFDGGWATEARLINGPITDFNIITRQGLCSAQVIVYAAQGRHRLMVDADTLLIQTLDGDLTIGAPQQEVMRLPADHLLRSNSPTPGDWELEGAAVICVQIKYA